MAGLKWLALATGLFVVFAAGATGSPQAEPRKHVLIIGGGDEPPGRTTIFDSVFDSLGKKLAGAGYEARVVYDGGHAGLERLAKKHFSGRRADATHENLSGEIRRLTEDIREGRIQKGDQLLVASLSHGSAREAVVLSHKIAGTEGWFSLDELIPLREAAEKAGVRLAVIDHSCYSGAALALATPNTCVISSTGEDYVGYISEKKAFWASAEKGQTLESIFLKARKRTTEAVNPMISGEPGRRTDHALRRVQDRLLHHPNDFGGRPDTAKDCESCIPNPAAKSGIFGLIEEIEESLIPEKVMREIKSSGEAHRRIYEKLLSLNALRSELGSRQEMIAGVPWQWDYLHAFDRAVEKTRITKLKKENPQGPLGSYYERVLSSLDEMAKKRDELMSANREFRQIGRIDQEMAGLFKELKKVANRIGKSERALYDVLYETMRNEGPNPCSEFVF